MVLVTRNGHSAAPGLLERPVPYNLEAEEAVLGALLIDRDAVVKIAPFLAPADFYRETNGWVYEAVLDLYHQRRPADVVLLADELARRGRLELVGGYAALFHLSNATPTAVHIEYYAHLVARASVQRRMITLGGQIAALGYEEAEDTAPLIAKMQQLVLRLSAHAHVGRGRLRLADALEAYYDQITSRDGALGGISTGLPDLDDCIDGLVAQQVIVVSAPSSGGKSALGLSLALAAARQEKQVLIFSYEMSADDYCQRVLAHESGLSGVILRTGRLDAAEWTTVNTAFGTAHAGLGQHIWLEPDPSLTVADMFSVAWEQQATDGLDLVIVDYVQLVEALPGTASDRHELGVKDAMKRLLALAKQLNVPVVVLSQENDEGQTRESRTIEHTAHIWIQIRADLDPTKIPAHGRVAADLIVRKNRNGAKDLIPALWELKTNRFAPRTDRYNRQG